MKTLKVIGGLLGLVLAILSPIWNGYALAILWSWFIVPVFNLPALSIPAAMGVALIVSYLTHHADDKKDERESNPWAFSLAVVMLRPLVALGVGALIHAWM